MNRTEYKNNFGREHYERINLVVPKGMKDIIKALASSKGMSVNAYMQDLVRKDQCGLFDTMQIAEKNRDMISGITGNMHDGYDIIFKDGHSCHCRTKKDVRSCIEETIQMRFREIEKIVLNDGWELVDVRGSHHQYKHPTKTGKVTIPNHRGDIPQRVVNSILKQAGLK